MVNDENIYSTIELDQVSSAILNALNAHIALIDQVGRVVAYNRKWKEFSDELQESWSHPVLDENMLKCLQAPLASGSDSALRLLLGIKEVLNGEKSTFSSKLCVDHHGQMSWFRVSFNSIGFEKGGVLVYEDISHQTKSQQFLRETKEKLKKYFQNSPYGILVADENQVVIEVNEEACNVLEASPDELTYSDINNFLDVDMDAGNIQKTINRSGNYLGEFTITSSSGKEIPVELSVLLFRNDKGKPVVSWVFKDITTKKITEQALKESEQQYKLQFNNTLEGTIIGSPEGRILAVNPAACDMLGYTENELVGQQRPLVFDTDIPANARALEKRRNEGHFSGEVIFTHKNGHTIYGEISSVIYTAEDGSQKTITSIKDISERKAIQQQLIQEKEFTESAISSLPASFFVFKKSGELVRWNTMLEDDFGYSPKELSSMNILDLVHPDDRKSINYFLQREMTGDKVNLETRGINKNGDVLHYLISGTSFTQNGEQYIVGSGLNQNNFKQIENERNRNAELLSQLFDNSPIGIVLIDAKGKVKKLNNSFEQLFGYTNSELAGRELDEAIVPDFLSTHAKTLSKVSFTGDVFQTEALRQTKDGKEVPVLIGGVPVELNGEVIALYGMYVDISERKKLENQIVDLLESEKKARLHLQDIFEEAPSAIAMLEGEAHTYTFANNRYRELVGRSDLVGHSIGHVLPELGDQGIIRMMDSCYYEGRIFHFTEQKLYFRDEETGNKSVHYLNFVVKPMYDDKLNIYGVFIEAVDVTEQVQARKIIEESLAEKETLLNEVHHRVKNNLAIVSGLLELEMMGSDDTNVSQHLKKSQSRITTIARVHELLYQNASLSHVNFKNFLESVMTDQNKLTGAKGHKLISDFAIDAVVLNVNQAVPAGMLLNELLSFIEDETTIEMHNVNHKLLFEMEDHDSCIHFKITDQTNGNIYLPFIDTARKENELRMELIQVLLRQVNGELHTGDSSERMLSISFDKKDVKGPHSALNQ